MSPCGFVARRSVEGGGVTPSRRVDAATGPHGDTRRAGRESAATALLDWAIALLWPALAPCHAIFPASVTTAQLIGPDPSLPVPPRSRSLRRRRCTETGRAPGRERESQYV